jgi:hypothetical protein
LTHEINEDLKTLHWVAVALAVLCTIFDACIIGAYLLDYLEGLTRLAIVGILGANLVAIICAYLMGRTKNNHLFWTSLCSELLITGLLLYNVGNVFEVLKADKVEDRTAKRQIEQLKAQTEAEKELRRLDAELAKDLSGTDRKLGREFLAKKGMKAAPTPAAETAAANQTAQLSPTERKLLTSGPLYLALVVVGALLIAARKRPPEQKAAVVQPQPGSTARRYVNGKDDESETDRPN